MPEILVVANCNWCRFSVVGTLAFRVDEDCETRIVKGNSVMRGIYEHHQNSHHNDITLYEAVPQDNSDIALGTVIGIIAVAHCYENGVLELDNKTDIVKSLLPEKCLDPGDGRHWIDRLREG